MLLDDAPQGMNKQFRVGCFFWATFIAIFHLSEIFWLWAGCHSPPARRPENSVSATHRTIIFLFFCFFPAGRWGENVWKTFSFSSVFFHWLSMFIFCFCFVRNRVKVKAGCALITPKSSSLVNRPHPIIAPIPLTKGLRISQMGSHPWNVFLDHSLLFSFDRVLHDYSVAVVGQIVHNCWPADASAHNPAAALNCEWECLTAGSNYLKKGAPLAGMKRKAENKKSYQRDSQQEKTSRIL